MHSPLRTMLIGAGALAVLATPGYAALDPASPQLRAVPDLTFTPPTGERIHDHAIGDFTGDGQADVAVVTRPVGEGRDGRLLLFSRGIPVREWIGTSVGTELGRLTSVGDVDGDGRDDLLLEYYRARTDRQSAIVLGSAGPTAVADLTTPGPGHIRILNNDGQAPAPAGDVDGDGRSDVLMHRYQVSGGVRVDTWSVVYGAAALGDIDAASLPVGTREITTGALANASAGASAIAGDVNGDGNSDVTIQVGATGAVAWGGPTRGTIETFGDSSLANIADMPFLFRQGIVDVNGDGSGDLVDSNEVVFGGPAFPPASMSGAAVAPTGRTFPHSRPVAAGDIDGDGTPDLALTAEGAFNCLEVRPRSTSRVMLGSAAGAEPARAVILPGGKEIGFGDINADGITDTVYRQEFTRTGRPCLRTGNGIRVAFGQPLPTCAGPALPTEVAGFEEIFPGSSLRRARQAKVKVSVRQLRINQRVAADAIRRLNAVRDRLDSGIEGREICGGAIDRAKLHPSSAPTGQDPIARSAADPRPLSVATPSGEEAAMALTERQLLINQRIFQAAIARANALSIRMAELTGGDVKDGTVPARALVGDIATVAGGIAPAPSTTRIIPPKQKDLEGLKLTNKQVEINYRIALEVQRRAKGLQQRLEQGLIGENFADGSITAADLS